MFFLHTCLALPNGLVLLVLTFEMFLKLAYCMYTIICLSRLTYT